jgi:hypothetical protein
MRTRSLKKPSRNWDAKKIRQAIDLHRRIRFWHPSPRRNFTPSRNYNTNLLRRSEKSGVSSRQGRTAPRGLALRYLQWLFRRCFYCPRRGVEAGAACAVNWTKLVCLSRGQNRTCRAAVAYNFLGERIVENESIGLGRSISRNRRTVCIRRRQPCVPIEVYRGLGHTRCCYDERVCRQAF